MTASNMIVPDAAADAGYAPHRDIYRRLKDGLENDDDVLDELLGALGLLISEYDTSIRENRFIAGGATERILATAMRCVGIANARARGLDLSDEDIVVDGHQISVKGVRSRGGGRPSGSSIRWAMPAGRFGGRRLFSCWRIGGLGTLTRLCCRMWQGRAGMR